MSIGDFVVLALVACAAVLAGRLLTKQKKTGCTGSCSSCACACTQRVKGR